MIKTKGYDDVKKVFYTPVFFDINFEEKEISYDDFVKLYKHTVASIKEIYANHKYKFMYFGPITQINFKKNIIKLKQDIFSLYILLKKTLDNCNICGKVYHYGEFQFNYFNGLLGAINAILEEFDLYRYQDKKTYSFPKNIKSFISYRRLFYDCILSYDNISLKIPTYEEEEKTFKKLENILLILIKHTEYTDSIIENVREKLIYIFKSDLAYISNLLNFIENYFIDSINNL